MVKSNQLKFRKMNCRGILIILIIVLSFFGCTQHRAKIPRTSLAIKLDSKCVGTIDIANIRLDSSLMNKIIGYYHELLGSVPYYGTHANFSKSTYAPGLLVELRNANYPVLEPSTSMFTESSQELNKSDLSIGGTIVQLRFDSYLTTFERKKSKAKVAVKWELFDNSLSKVIYNKMTIGSATGPMSLTKTEPVTISAAVRSSFQKILSDRKFASAVENGLQKK